MSFNYSNLSLIGTNNTNNVTCYSYTTSAPLSEVVSTDFFSDPRSDLKAGDFIFALINGVTYTLTMTTATTAGISEDGATGWGNYQDTTYTSGSPFAVSADTDTVLPNDKASVIETQKPDDVTTFYDGTVITGRNGDGILITVDCKVLPTSGGTTYIEFWFDIGGSVGELYRRIVSFPKGSGVERPVNFTVAGYTLGTWEANGATVYCRSNGTCSLYDIRYLITRTHKAK